MAKIEAKLSGASSSNQTRIILENINGGKLISPGEIVSADDAIIDETRIMWAGPNDLRVVLCEATAYQVRARILRDPVLLPDGSENAVSVIVENWDHSEARKGCAPMLESAKSHLSP